MYNPNVLKMTAAASILGLGSLGLAGCGENASPLRLQDQSIITEIEGLNLDWGSDPESVQGESSLTELPNGEQVQITLFTRSGAETNDPKPEDVTQLFIAVLPPGAATGGVTTQAEKMYSFTDGVTTKKGTYETGMLTSVTYVDPSDPIRPNDPRSGSADTLNIGNYVIDSYPQDTKKWKTVTDADKASDLVQAIEAQAMQVATAASEHHDLPKLSQITLK